MSSAVCQGPQSYLDPWPKSTATRPYFPRSLSGARKVRLSDFNSEKHQQEKKKNEEELENNSNSSSSKKTNINNDRQNYNNNFSGSDSDKNNKNQSSSNGGDMGGWNFIQALANNSLGSKAAALEEKEKLYIQPLMKRSSSKLSERSLEMCTENLGSETGSVIREEDIITNSSDCKKVKERPKSSMRQLTKVNSREFPPPLTTISGSSQVQVRTHRDGGRLVMTAVRVPCSDSYFQAERADGRLRLHLSTNYTKRFDPEFDFQATEALHGEEEVDSEEEEEEEEVGGGGGEEEEEAEAEAEIEKGVVVEEERKEEEEKYRGEVEMENYERERRRKSKCNECSGLQNKLLLIQEPCWVATS